jgi:hypothetical protein
MYIEFLDIIISAVIFSGMGQGKDSGKLLFRKIFSDGSINITEDETSLTFSSTGGSGAAILQDRVAIGTGTGITHSFVCVGEIPPLYGGLTNVRSVRGSYDLTRASYNTGKHSFIIGGSTNSIQGGYYSTIVGGQTNSIVNGGAGDLIIGGSCNIVEGFKQYCSGNKIFGGYANEIKSGSITGEIFGGKLNKFVTSNSTLKGNKIIGGQQNEINDGSERSVILGGSQNSVITLDFGSFAGEETNCSKSNLILSAYDSSVRTESSNYNPSPSLGSEITRYQSKYNNIIGSRQSTISSQRSSYKCAPKYTNIIGGCKNESGGWYSNILSGCANCVIGNTNYNNTTNYRHMQIISSEDSRICGTIYTNIISSLLSYSIENSSRIHSRNIVSSFASQVSDGGNLFSTGVMSAKTGFGLASVGGKLCDGAQVISSTLPSLNVNDTATASTSMIISSNLDFFGESFGVDGFSTVTFCPGAVNNVYPQKNSLILSSSLVMNYNSFTTRTFFGGDQHSTTIISSNKILSGYNCKGYSPTFRPEGMLFNNGVDDPMTLLDNTLMISNYCSCQRTNANSLMISTINSKMSNGLFNSIIGGCSNQIKSFGPGFYFDYGIVNSEGDNDGRILRAIFGGEVPGVDLGLSRHNMILGGSYNGFYSICGQTLEIGTAGPGLLLYTIQTSGDILGGENLRRSMNTRYSSIIGGCCNRIIADIGTATPTGKNKGVVCNPILNSVILGGCGNEMRISNHTGVDNLIISGIPSGGTFSGIGGGLSIGISASGITGTFSAPITSIEVCKGFVVAVTTSDQRLKIIIEKIGQSNWNLNIYLFRYISDPERVYQGVIAQELLNTKYDTAVSTDLNGFYQVDYSKIDVEFKEVDYAKKDFQYSSI